MQPRIESRQDWLEESACRRAKGVTIRRSDGSGEPSGRSSELAFPARSPAPGINGLESHPARWAQVKIDKQPVTI